MTFKKARAKIFEHLVSWKFHLLVLSTWLLWHDKLTESGWLMIAASTTGLRELVNLVTLKMGAQSQPDIMSGPVNPRSYNQERDTNGNE